MSYRKYTEEKRSQFEEVETEITKLHSEIQDISSNLQDFQNSIEQIPEQYQDLSDAERDAFYEEFSSLVAKAEGIDNPVDLVQLQEELNSAYKSPLRDSIQSIQKEIVTTVGLGDEDKLHQTIQKTTTGEFTDPAKAREKYNQIHREINSLDDIQQKKLRQYLRQSPTQLLYPNELVDFVEGTRQTKASLSELDTSLNEKQWWPDDITPLTKRSALYDGNLNQTESMRRISHIDEKTYNLDNLGIPATKSVHEYVSRREEQLSSVIEFLEPINKYLTKILDLQETLQSIQNLRSSGIESLEQLSFITDFDKKSSYELEELGENISDIVGEYNQWVQSKQDQWEQVSTRISRMKSQIENIKQLPEEVESHLNQEIFTSLQIVEAFQILQSAENWIQDQLAYIGDNLTPRAENILESLLEEGSTSITESDVDAIIELLKYIDLRVELDD